MPGGFSTWDQSFGIALGDELTKAQPRTGANNPDRRPRQWQGLIHSLEIYADPIEESQIRDWLVERTPFQAREAASIDFMCPKADSTPWMVTSCDVSGVTDVDGRYCEYFVHSGSEELGMGPNCEDFCQEIGMRTCSLNGECCGNNPPDDV